MQLRRNQRGAGLFGLAYILGTLGFIVFVGMKVWPIYLNETKLERAVRSVAAEMDGGAESGSKAMRDALQKWWNVEDIEHVKPTDVKIKPGPSGKVMYYDYWNQVELFKNVFLSFHYAKEFPVGSGAKY
jgi:hypothetical protein